MTRRKRREKRGWRLGSAVAMLKIMGCKALVKGEPEKAQTIGSSSGFPVGEKVCFYVLEVIAFYCDSSGRLR
jgi:hypothetical protein